MREQKLRSLRDASKDEGRLFSDYGEFVLLLEADPLTLMEAMNDSSPEQLLKVISTIEDRLNDGFIHEDGFSQNVRSDEESFKRLVFLREFAKIKFRQSIGVEAVAQAYNYDPTRDPVLEDFESELNLPEDYEEGTLIPANNSDSS